ncbi:MAG: class III extradiol ring-cleavage dioxygenase [Hyphomicrobiales bacterium]
MAALPTLFVSHGSPDIALRATPAHEFLKGLAGTLPRPRAILVATAHFMTAMPAVSAPAEPETIYDFGGFPDPLYEMVYPARGDTELGREIAGRIAAAGFEAGFSDRRGLDHGTWIPLILAWPKADVPVLQLSVQPRLDAAHHLAVGRAIAGLREEGILVIGSGAMTHNLREAFAMGPEADNDAVAWVDDFADWIDARAEAGDVEALVDYRARAPHAARNHPTDEHLLPLHVALGAAGEGAKGTVLHRSRDYGALRMDAISFS